MVFRRVFLTIKATYPKKVRTGKLRSREGSYVPVRGSKVRIGPKKRQKKVKTDDNGNAMLPKRA